MTVVIPWAWFYVLGRIVGFVALAPVWSWRVMPPWIAGILALVLTVAVAPGITAPAPASWLVLGGGFLGQVTIGLIMGITLAVVLAGIEMAGTLVGQMLGIGIGASADPGVMVTGPGFSTTFGLLAMLAFVASGGLLLGIQALHDSFQSLPIGHYPVLSVAWIGGLGETLLATALLLGAPILGAIMLVIVAIGMINRAFPGLSAYFIAMPLGILVALLILWLFLPALPSILSGIWTQGWTTLSHLLAVWGGHGHGHG